MEDDREGSYDKTGVSNAAGETGEDAKKSSRRPRHTFAKEQKRILEEAFQESPSLCKARCQELMERSGIGSQRSIMVWFSNRRVKAKKQTTKKAKDEAAKSDDGASPTLSSPVEQNGSTSTATAVETAAPAATPVTRTRKTKQLKFRYPRGPRRKNRTPPRMMPLPKIPDSPHSRGPPDIRLPLSELKFMLTCTLCKGYLYNATTLTECLHSFCKACLLRYVVKNLHCPTCKLLIHPSNPYLNIRVDHTVQDILYKILPEVREEEKKTEEEFYVSRGLPYPPKIDQAGTPPAVEAELSDNASDTSADSDESEESVSDPPDWTSVLLQYAGVSDGLGDFEPIEKNFLRVSSEITVGQIRNLVKKKLDFGYRTDAEVYIFVDTTLVHDSLSLDKVRELFFTGEEDELIILQYGVVDIKYNMFEQSQDAPQSGDSESSDDEGNWLYERDVLNCSHEFLTKTVELDIEFPKPQRRPVFVEPSDHDEKTCEDCRSEL